MAKRKWTKEEVKTYRDKHDQVFYFNKEDANLFVSKAYGFGMTMNWAHPVSWAFAVIILCVLIWSMFNK